MKKLIIFTVVLLIFVSLGITIDVNNATDVLIYTSNIDCSNVELQKCLREKFPNYKIDIQYMSTGKSAAKIMAEGTRTNVDIVLDLELAYCKKLESNFASLDFIDDSKYLDKLVISDKFLPNCVFSCAIIINTKRLKEKDLPIPKSYNDLLKPIYKNEIVMPSPKASGTGYSFVLGMLNILGEKDGWEYFEKLNKNIKMYTSSGSAPLNMLINSEVTIGIGMVFQAVNQINAGSPLEILTPSIGNPYNTTSNAIIKGKEKKKKVREVFEFIQNEFVKINNKKFCPEAIYKEDVEISIKNYPTLNSIDMKGIESLEEKERILNLWKHS